MGTGVGVENGLDTVLVAAALVSVITALVSVTTALAFVAAATSVNCVSLAGVETLLFFLDWGASVSAHPARSRTVRRGRKSDECFMAMLVIR